LKAAQINGYGGADALVTTDAAEKPVPGEGEVLVEVYAASANPFDWKVREGLTQSMAQLSFPATLGGDVAGVVSEVGPGVENFKTGQAVYGVAGALSGKGSFAEFTPVSAGQLASKPESLDYVASAALPLVAVSAYQALVDHIGLQAGQKILIHGAAGGIGSIAVQLAKHLGAIVAATAGSDDLEFVKQLGADEVIDYKSQQFESELDGLDAVFDTVGGDTYTRSFDVLKEGGTLVSMVETANENLAAKTGVNAIYQFTQAATERLQKVAELADQKAITVHVDKTFPLDQAGEALEYLHTGHPRGKVVIQVKP
jgi:NADPH:quinone reductase-like Zn-dependent oxidoreductase